MAHAGTRSGRTRGMGAPFQTVRARMADAENVNPRHFLCARVHPDVHEPERINVPPVATSGRARGSLLRRLPDSRAGARALFARVLPRDADDPRASARVDAGADHG